MIQSNDAMDPCLLSQVSGADAKSSLSELCARDWASVGFSRVEQSPQPCWKATSAQRPRQQSKQNVCLPDATDVVPIAGAPVRWRGVSSNTEVVNGVLFGVFLLEGWRAHGKTRQASRRKHGRWGHIQLLQSFALHTCVEKS